MRRRRRRRRTCGPACEFIRTLFKSLLNFKHPVEKPFLNFKHPVETPLPGVARAVRAPAGGGGAVGPTPGRRCRHCRRKERGGDFGTRGGNGWTRGGGRAAHAAAAAGTLEHSDATVANRNVRGFGWERSLTGAVSRRPPISLDTIEARTHTYMYAAKVWELSIVQGAIFFCRPVPVPGHYDSQLVRRCTQVDEARAAASAAEESAAAAAAEAAEWRQRESRREAAERGWGDERRVLASELQAVRADLLEQRRLSTAAQVRVGSK